MEAESRKQQLRAEAEAQRRAAAAAQKEEGARIALWPDGSDQAHPLHMQLCNALSELHCASRLPSRVMRTKWARSARKARLRLRKSRCLGRSAPLLTEPLPSERQVCQSQDDASPEAESV